MITTTLELDRCWVCESKSYLHQHHVIPRACGGTNGPTVTLCSSCHNGIHDLSKVVSALEGLPEQVIVRAAQNIVPYWTAKLMPKFMYLTRVIYKAETATVNSLHRRIKVSLELPTVDHQRLNEVKRMLGLRSNEATLAACIQRVHASLTKTGVK